MDRKLILDFDRKQKQQKHQKSKQQNTHKDSSRRDKKTKLDQDEPTPSSSISAIYRDRAQERREGLNKDFELDPDDLIISNPVVDCGSQEVDEAERRRQQIEDSKYLGGDVEHTHLVKGLDFALLEKIKSAEKLAESSRDHEHSDSFNRLGGNAMGELILAGSDSDEEEFTREAIRAATATTTNKRQIDIEKLRKSEMIPCRTAIARRILNALDDEKWASKSELFEPGRMNYVFSLDEETDTQVTTVLRSKAEQAESEAPVSEKDLAFDQLINIFAKIRNNKPGNNK